METAAKPAPQVDYKNRRKWLRRKTRSTEKVECRKGSLGLGANLGIILLDISEAGVRLILKAALKPKDEVEVVIRDHGPQSTIKRIGEVMWCLALDDGRFCVGVQFEKWILFGESSLRQVLSQYVDHFHGERNHQGKGNVILFPMPADRIGESTGEIQTRERLGGLLKFYYRQAA